MSLASGDLTTLAAVQAYYGSGTGPAVATISGLIPRISRWILNEINRPFILPKAYVQNFYGSGTRQLMLPNWPVLSLASLYIDGGAIQQATMAANGINSNCYGWNFQIWNGVPPGEPAVLTLGGGASFWRGAGSVVVSYSAGYQVTEETAIVPATPFQITPIQPYGIWASDQGVTLNGVVATAISAGVPGAGQYLPPALDAAVPRQSYTFAAADVGKTALMSYGFVPADLEQVALELILERSAYRSRPGIRSQSLASQETVTYDTNPKGLSFVSQSILNSYTSVLPPAMGVLV